MPAVSILKPLCGDEPALYDNLATFCRQTHPHYQLVFGVRDGADPAIQVVRRLQQDYPERDIALAVNGARHGSNPKVSNLINLLPLARHDLLVLADADIAVEPDYLTRVSAPLADVRTGVVTCLYRGRAMGGWWSRLGVQFIDGWFAPSVHVAHFGGSRSFAFGATIALRRDALQAIGGFAALADRLADDYWLGELTRRHGLVTVLSDVVVRTDVTEDSLAELWRHELRWMRTIRSLNPAGFAFSFITFTWPMLLLGLALAPGAIAIALLLAGGAARSMLAVADTRRGAGASGVDLAAVLTAPLRDLLLLAEWAAALTGSRVHWRDNLISVRDRLPAAPPSYPSSPSRKGTLPERTP
ncbi:glycosyltransferase [Duganella callida]|uniref:Glycosyltransferase n=2 Tax=Duganella callida TaxID=2561932 RepID=A0A4Y9SNU6_9BURK|nr:glycosyltransferase [Duganella callida]